MQMLYDETLRGQVKASPSEKNTCHLSFSEMKNIFLYVLYSDRACLGLMRLVNWEQHEELQLINELILRVMLNYW